MYAVLLHRRGDARRTLSGELWVHIPPRCHREVVIN